MQNKKGGLLFGVIVGTLLGVLFAPRKGKELRGQLKKEIEKGGLGTGTLKENFIEMGHDMAETAQKISEKPEVKRTIKKGKQHAEKIYRKAKEKVEEVGSNVAGMGQDLYEKAGEKIEEGLDKIQDTLDGQSKKHGNSKKKSDEE